MFMTLALLALCSAGALLGAVALAVSAELPASAGSDRAHSVV